MEIGEYYATLISKDGVSSPGRKNQGTEDMANNYKDNAQDDFAELEKVFEELTAAKKLNERQQEYYCDKIHEYREILKGYTHKDQKATW